MDQQDIDFSDACDAFTEACQRATHWKDNYFGARYSTRLVQAIIDLEKDITRVKLNPEIAEQLNERALNNGQRLLKAAREALAIAQNSNRSNST